MNQVNENGKAVGYWEFYFFDGQLYCKGYYDNGKPVGYWEEYHFNGDLRIKELHV